MNVRTFLRLTALTTGIIGVVLVVVPSFIGNFFIAATDHHTDIFIQFVGSSLIGYTYLNWHTAAETDARSLRPALIGNFATLLVAFMISLIGVLDGGLKATGWLIVLLHFVFGSGFGWYLKSRPSKA